MLNYIQEQCCAKLGHNTSIIGEEHIISKTLKKFLKPYFIGQNFDHN